MNSVNSFFANIFGTIVERLLVPDPYANLDSLEDWVDSLRNSPRAQSPGVITAATSRVPQRVASNSTPPLKTDSHQDQESDVRSVDNTPSNSLSLIKLEGDHDENDSDSDVSREEERSSKQNNVASLSSSASGSLVIDHVYPDGNVEYIKKNR